LADVLQIFGFIVELVSIALFIIVIYSVLRIGKATGFFTAWNLIVAAFILIIVRRLLSFIQPYVPNSELIKDIGVPVTLLIITILYILGFRKLSHTFEKKAS
jgi:hypothetical protein